MTTPTLRPVHSAIEKEQIAIGDRVVCIDDSSSFHRLVVGGTYPVTKAYDGSPTVEVNRSYYSLERFRKI